MQRVALFLTNPDAEPIEREVDLARVPVVGDLIQVDDVDDYRGFFKVVTATFRIRGEDAEIPRIVGEYYGP